MGILTLQSYHLRNRTTILRKDRAKEKEIISKKDQLRTKNRPFDIIDIK